jgi:hypothetical protein
MRHDHFELESSRDDLSLCRSSKDPLLSPSPSPSSKGIKSKHIISCGVNLR